MPDGMMNVKTVLYCTGAIWAYLPVIGCETRIVSQQTEIQTCCTFTSFIYLFISPFFALCMSEGLVYA